jgi:hypothetical protein
MFRQFQSFRFSSSTRSLEEKKSFEGPSPDQFLACEDGILSAVQSEGWYQVRSMSDERELVLSVVVAMVKGADVSLKGIIPITSWLSSSGQSKLF